MSMSICLSNTRAHGHFNEIKKNPATPLAIE